MESPLSRIRSAMQWLLLLAVVLAMAALAWQWGKVRVMRDAYRVRLQDLEARHNQLVNDYNQAIARTAVCEVRQKSGKLTVVVRTQDGQSEEIPLDFDPSHEIYFDFICLDGHLQMRRVFDDQTAPAKGVLIQSKLAHIDWAKHSKDRGSALYCPLTQEGRYAIKVSGNGALTLEKMTADEIANLKYAPTLRQFEPVPLMKNAGDEPGVGEIVKSLWQ